MGLGGIMNPLQEIQEIAEKALCYKNVPYRIQKALSQIIVKARTYESTTSNNSGKKQG